MTPTRLLVRLRLIGPPQLTLGDEKIHALERKDAALLAFLALEGPTPRAKAAALLWPDVDADGARNNLRQRLHRLKKIAGDEVVTAGDTLALGSEVPHDLDATANRIATEDQAADGELLGQLDYSDCSALAEWVNHAREKVRSARRAALDALAALLESQGQIARALRLAERLVNEDALAESTHRRLMRLHYRRGDRAAALAAYRHCTDLLRRQLGTAPGAATRELAELIDAGHVLDTGSPKPRPLAALRPPRLIGREVEWRALETAWQAQQVTLVIGEPGIGKSRLLTEFATARAGVVIVGSRPDDARLPHAFLARLLSRLQANYKAPAQDWAKRELARVSTEFDSGPSPAGDVNPVRLTQAVCLYLAEATRNEAAPLAGLVLDDLQFADAESLDLLPGITLGDGLNLRWLLGARDHELPPAVHEWLAAKGASAPLRIALAPLTEVAVLSLLESLALPDVDARAWAHALHGHTGGNPLFILETLLALLQPEALARTGKALPAPANIGQLIETRLNRLGAVALSLARVAALAGKNFSVELAAQVLGKHPLDLSDPWNELVEAHVIRDNGFAHDLMLEATQRSMPSILARSLHQSIAEYLDRLGTAAIDAAFHWQAAQQWQHAGAAWQRAAQQALELSRRAEELVLLRRAAECVQNVPQPDDRERFDIELRSARAALLIDRADQSRAFAQAALALAHDAAARASALAVLAEAAEFMGEGEQALEHAAQGLALSVEIDAPNLVLTLAGLLGRLRAARGAFEAALQAFDDHAGWLERCEGGLAARMFLAQQSVVLDHARRRREAVAVGLRALELSNAARDATTACLCHANLGSFYARLGAGEDAVRHLEEALRLREQVGDAGGQTELARIYLGVVLPKTGRYREALELSTTGYTRLALGKAMPWAIIAQNVVARTYAMLGQPARGIQLLRETPPDLPGEVLALRYINEARVLRALGLPRARQIAEAERLFAQHAQHEGDLLVRLEQAIDSEPAKGAELAAAVESEAKVRMHGPLELDAQIAGCACLLTAGAVDDAAAKARAMLETAQRSTCWTAYPAEVFWRAFQAFDAAGDVQAANAALAGGFDWVNRVALPNVPDEFKDSFLNRNPINRALLTTASRRLKT